MDRSTKKNKFAAFDAKVIRERELMLRVIDGCHDKHVLISMHQLVMTKRSREILRWLIKTGRTGKQYSAILQHDFAFSTFQMAKWVLSQIDRDLETRRSLNAKEFGL